MPSKSRFAEVHIDVSPDEAPQMRAILEPEFPFRIVLAGNFSGRAETVPEPAEVDPDNFEEVMRRWKPSLSLPLAEPGAKAEIEFRELDDFHPDRLYGRVKAFDSFKELRRLLSEPRPRREAAPAPPPPAGGFLDQIITQAEPRRVEAAEVTSGQAWNELIQGIVAPHLTPKADQAQTREIERVDAAAGELMRGLLHYPAFQNLEANWRSVFFLLRRLETGTDLKIYLADTSRAALPARFESMTDTTLDEPWALVVGLHTFRPEAGDLDRLERIARAAARHRTPFVAGADLEAWNRPVPADISARWEALRRRPEAAWVALALPRLVLRLPYGRATSPIEVFPFEEMPSPPEHERYLWGNPAVAVAALLGQAFSRAGWDLSGKIGRGLDGLPVHNFEHGGAKQMKPCAESWLTEAAVERILDHGFIPLISIKNRDSVLVPRLQSIAEPATRLCGRWA